MSFSFIQKTSLTIILISLTLILLIIAPFAKQGIIYQFKTHQTTQKIPKPINLDFSIIIPKIFVNAPVKKNIDPANYQEYSQTLKTAVAHAKGSSLPDQTGNTYLFAHSSLLPWERTKYGPVFFLLPKLKKGDDIYIFYKEKKYHYKVGKIQIVSPDKTGFLYTQTNTHLLTLQTCYPPGSNTQRLIIQAKLQTRQTQNK